MINVKEVSADIFARLIEQAYDMNTIPSDGKKRTIMLSETADLSIEAARVLANRFNLLEKDG